MLPNWFERHIPTFEEFLGPLANQGGLTFLQIGAYAGHCSRWLAENILTGYNSWLYDVDTWEGSDDEAITDWREVVRTYQKLTHDLPVKAYWMTSDHFFAGLKHDTAFDFIYVDGSHHASQVMADAENAHKCLKPGGILAFDDYLWDAPSRGADVPHTAINMFMAEHLLRSPDYDVLHSGVQMWLRKKEN